MRYVRMPIEAESPEQLGYDRIKYNLSESSVTDRQLGDFPLDFRNILLCYGDHLGIPELRAEIAKPTLNLKADNVLVTAGAAAALFIIMTTLLDQDSHVVVLRPNYAINIEVLKAIGCKTTYLDLKYERDFRLDFDQLEAAIRPETKLVSLTYPHNPTGVTLTPQELQQVIDIVEAKDCLLLFDETYGDMTRDAILPAAASLSAKALSVSSLSKTYGIPGIRIGWIMSQDQALLERFLSAKELIGICGSMVDETIALAALQQRDLWIPQNNQRIQKALAKVRQWAAEEKYISWIEPQGGCVSFPRITADIDLDHFYTVLFEKYQTYVGPGHWFEQSRHHFRVGHAWPTLEALEGGLKAISSAIRESLR